MKHQENKPLNKKVLWFAFLFAIIFYNLIGLVIAQTMDDFKGYADLEQDRVVQLMSHAAWGAAFVIFFFALVLIRNKRSTNLFTVILALLEVVPILGLIMFLLTGDISKLLLLSFVSFSLMALAYPREEKV